MLGEQIACVRAPARFVLCGAALQVALSLHNIGASETIAFPGAVGQGAAASGGRGGDVYHVTTLDDYRPNKDPKILGSLRHAIRSATGPRTIVFDVGGPIALTAPLEVLKSNLTIAGQTAPAPGVTLWGYPFEISRGSNIVVRYLRVRLGDFHAVARDSGKPHPYPGNGDLDAGSANAVHIGGRCQRVIVDHVSTAWGMDETLSVTMCRDVTVQHSIIASSLNDSFHPKGPHGYGTLVRGELTAEDQSVGRGGFTFYGNLWAHHRARNPSIGGQQRLLPGHAEEDRRRTDVNLVNNVIYNWGDQPTHRSQAGAVRINMVGNYYINGPENGVFRIFKEGEVGKTAVFASGNFIDADQDRQHNGIELVTAEQHASAFVQFRPNDQLLTRSNGRPHTFLESVAPRLRTAEEAYLQVIRSVGCSLVRDAVDQAIIDSVKGRTGRIIDTQEQLRDAKGTLQGIDDMAMGRRPADFDTDGDGLPNDFEARNGLDPNNANDAQATTISPNGYTNLEVYLAELIHRL